MALAAIGFGVFTAVFGAVNPAQAPHAFHNTMLASLLIVIAAPPLVVVARAPDRPTEPLIAFAAVAVAAVGTMVLALTIDPSTLPFVVLGAVLWALAWPRLRPVPAGAPSVPLLGLSLLVA